MTYLLDQAILANLFNAERFSSTSSEIDSPISTRQCANDGDMFETLFDLGELRFLKNEESIVKDISLDIQRDFATYNYTANN